MIILYCILAFWVIQWIVGGYIIYKNEISTYIEKKVLDRYYGYTLTFKKIFGFFMMAVFFGFFTGWYQLLKKMTQSKIVSNVINGYVKNVQLKYERKIKEKNNAGN